MGEKQTFFYLRKEGKTYIGLSQYKKLECPEIERNHCCTEQHTQSRLAMENNIIVNNMVVNSQVCQGIQKDYFRVIVLKLRKSWVVQKANDPKQNKSTTERLW